MGEKENSTKNEHTAAGVRWTREQRIEHAAEVLSYEDIEHSIKMWHRVYSKLKRTRKEVYVEFIKRSYCEYNHIKWHCQCSLCHYIGECKKCPLGACGNWGLWAKCVCGSLERKKRTQAAGEIIKCFVEIRKKKEKQEQKAMEREEREKYQIQQAKAGFVTRYCEVHNQTKMAMSATRFELKHALRMWEQVRDNLVDYGEKTNVKAVKNRYCMTSGMNWQNDCVFCEHADGCESCPLQSCGTGTLYWNIKNDETPIEERIASCEKMIAEVQKVLKIAEEL